MLVGNEFQIYAAEMQKAQDPKHRLCCGFTSWWESDERRLYYE